MLEHELTPECRSIFQQSAELARLGVFIVDLASGRCLYCSQELARMFGLPVSTCVELIGTDARLERVHADDREAYRAAVAKALRAKGRYQIEYRMHDAGGDLLHVREMAEHVASEGGSSRLVGCVQDLSESKRVEAALQQVNQTLERRVAERTAELRAAKEAAEAAEQAATASNNRFLAAAEALRDGLAIFDAEDRLAFYNRRYPDHAPPVYSEALRIGERFSDIIRTATAAGEIYHAEMGQDFVERRLSHHRATAEDQEFRIADGRWVRVRESAIDGGGRVLLTSDITQQKEATNELEERERRLRTIADGIPLPIVIARANQAEVLFVNELAAEMFDLRVGPQAEAIRAVYADPMDGRRLFRRVLEDGSVDGFEVRLRRADGSMMWALMYARVIAVAGEKAVLTTAVDITERTKAEAELEEREERFRAVAEGVPLVVTIARLDPPELLFANARAEEAFGLRAGADLERILRTYRDLDDRRRLVEQVAQDGRVDSYEVQLRRLDGSIIWALISARAITFHGRPAMLTAVTEINDLKVMEQALRDSEARLAAFMENAPVAMYLKDLEGRYVLANPEMSKVFARPAHQMVGRTAADTLGAHDLDAVVRRDREVLRSGQAMMVEEHAADLDAYSWSMVIRFPIRGADDRITHLGGFHLDITQRKAIEEALRASEHQFRVLAEAHPVPLFIVRIDDGRVLVATPPCAALLKVPQHELIGATIHPFHADPEIRARLVEQLRRDGALNGVEVRFRRADGDEFWGSITSRPIIFEGEDAVVTAIVDLTERKRIEAELEHQTELLHQNEKLSALGSLLAGVAHELNNPLSLVVGYAGLLEEMAPDGATKERAIKVRVAADRCARIVRTFLSMARNKPRAPGPVRLNAVVEASLEIVAYGLRTADIEVERTLAPDLPPVLGDPDQLHQVLANLLANAQQALQTVSPPRRLRITTGGDGEAVWVAIADNGPGIPATIANRIFEPFFTTKPQGVGTGVGLSVSHGIIAAHGGQILVESEPGQGTTFTVRLMGAPAQRPEQAQPDAPRGNRRARILVVDDEPEIARLLTDLLEGDGHEVASASSGREALDWLSGREVDLIITDLRMPDMDGPALYRSLAERRPELLTRVVFITGDTLAADITGFLSETGVHVIEKPLDPPDVSRRIQVLLADYEALSAASG